jgi:hypothetical protein
MAAEKKQQYAGYPKIKEGPKIPYKNDTTPNPVLKGNVLLAAAWL